MSDHTLCFPFFLDPYQLLLPFHAVSFLVLSSLSFLCLQLFCTPSVKVALVPIATHSELLLISVYAACWMASILLLIPAISYQHSHPFIVFFFFSPDHTEQMPVQIFRHFPISNQCVSLVAYEDWEATLGNVPPPRLAVFVVFFPFFLGR